MDPVTVSTTIARPREEVFDYLADAANLPEFTDHFLHDFHLTRVDSVGRGAGARFRVARRLDRFGWGEMTYAEVEAPHLIVARGRGGKMNRIRSVSRWELSPAPGGTTRVDWTYETRPPLVSDRIMESLGARGWTRRRHRKALRRLRSILEEDRDRGARATVAAG
ncbi:MAG: SRPBCC family protein [Solirubrobacteraceae bacterium]